MLAVHHPTAMNTCSRLKEVFLMWVLYKLPWFSSTPIPDTGIMALIVLRLYINSFVDKSTSEMRGSAIFCSV